ncbi:MAG: hemerythrin domain-containing protein [Actinobacteria bacterium]|nr:hemerythrin domain-containing protein [Actinomycetota bacterium]
MREVEATIRGMHGELLRRVEVFRSLADAVGALTVPELAGRIDRIRRFLTEELVPHARAEDRVLYPAVERAVDGDLAVRLMGRDHLELSRLAQELDLLRGTLRGEALTRWQASAIRRVLYGLYSILGLHLAKEDELILPLVDGALDGREARALLAALEEAEHPVLPY